MATSNAALSSNHWMADSTSMPGKMMSPKPMNMASLPFFARLGLAATGAGRGSVETGRLARSVSSMRE